MLTDGSRFKISQSCLLEVERCTNKWHLRLDPYKMTCIVILVHYLARLGGCMVVLILMKVLIVVMRIVMIMVMVMMTVILMKAMIVVMTMVI